MQGSPLQRAPCHGHVRYLPPLDQGRECRTVRQPRILPGCPAFVAPHAPLRSSPCAPAGSMPTSTPRNCPRTTSSVRTASRSTPGCRRRSAAASRTAPPTRLLHRTSREPSARYDEWREPHRDGMASRQSESDQYNVINTRRTAVNVLGLVKYCTSCQNITAQLHLYCKPR